MRAWKVLLGTVLLLITAPSLGSGESESGPVRNLAVKTGRSFGYVLGDRIRHEIQFVLEKSYILERERLPGPGPIKEWLDLLEITVTESEQSLGTRYRIVLLYQIFPSIRKPETLRIPGLALSLFNGENSLYFQTSDTAITVNPLIPGSISDADVTMPPAIAPEPIPTQLHWQIIATSCTAMTIILGFLGWQRDWLPFLLFRKSAFGSARKQLSRWRKAKPESPEYRNALLTVHRALNEAAGETIFASELERFFDGHPDFVPMRAKTRIFFALSQQIFFTKNKNLVNADYSVTWLEQFCHEYHKIERYTK